LPAPSAKRAAPGKGSDLPPLQDEGKSRERLADLLIKICAILGGLAYLPSAYLSLRASQWLVLGVDTLAFLLFLLLAFKPSLPYKVKLGALLGASYALGIVLLAMLGPVGAGPIYLFCFVILAGLFGTAKVLVAANILVAASYAGAALAAALGLLGWAKGPGTVAVLGANAALIGAVLSAAAHNLISGYAATAAAEARLRRLREMMLREIDHRVKNNLQMITSLVSLRARSSADPAKSLQNIQDSLSAIVLVHQLLDREGSHYRLKVKRFLSALFERFGASYPELRFEFGWDGPEMEVDSQVGIDLGVMVNEIATNSIKHAFVGRRGGNIFLKVEAEGRSRVLSMLVGDDGAPEGGGAWPESPEGGSGQSAGQGRQIVDALAKRFAAKMSLDRSKGFVYRFELSLPEAEGLEE
jgi:two-component sensor histidine kinase